MKGFIKLKLVLSLAAVVLLAGTIAISLSGTLTHTRAASSCGVTQNSDGTYHFSWLHLDGQGNVVDEKNCVVHLLGINQGSLSLSDANGTTQLTSLEQGMVFFHQSLPSNIVRVNYNAYWWDTDVYVPNAQMHYQQWLQTFVHLEEQAGNYVELDTGPNFHSPPCGNDGMGYVVTFCPSQKQSTHVQDPTQAIDYQPTPLQSLTELATIYANDPAILFDVWNEPFLSTLGTTTFFTDMNQRIDAVRANAPNALVVVFARYYPTIMQGKAPNYQQPNLLLDHHIYNSNFTAAQIMPALTYARAHGQGIIVNEYGGATPSAQALNELSSLARAYDTPLVYYQANNLDNKQNTALNANGLLVHNAYTSI